MKLHRFIALDMQRATVRINQVLGTDAIIYSTRKTPYGVEIIAGLELGKDEETKGQINTGSIQLQETESIHDLVDKLSIQLQNLHESISKLTADMHYYSQLKNKKSYTLSLFFQKIIKLCLYKPFQEMNKEVKEEHYKQLSIL